jgi:ribonuclease E
MKKEMLINVLQPEECRIAIVEDGVLEELYVERTSHESYTGNIYQGKIVNLEPAIQAAFVDFSVGRNGFLHVSDVEAQYFDRNAEERGEPDPRPRDRDRPRANRRDRDRGRSRDDRGRSAPASDRGPGASAPASFGYEERTRDRGRDELRDRPREIDPAADAPAPAPPPLGETPDEWGTGEPRPGRDFVVDDAPPGSTPPDAPWFEELPPDRGRERRRDRDRPDRGRERERPDLSIRGRRDRSEPPVRRFGEGLVEPADVEPERPQRAAAPAQPAHPAEEAAPRAAQERPVPPEAAWPVGAEVFWNQEEPLPRQRDVDLGTAMPPELETGRTQFARELFGEREDQPLEPFEADLPLSRTRRARLPREAGEDSGSRPEQPDVSANVPPVYGPSERRADTVGDEATERARGREPRRGRGRGRAPSRPERRVPAPPPGGPGSSPLEGPRDAGPEEAKDLPELDLDRPAGDSPRRRGRAAIRSRGGDWEGRRDVRSAPEGGSGRPARGLTAPDEPEPAGGTTGAPGRRGESERRHSQGISEQAREHDRDRDRAPRPHGRAGEPGYVPRRERQRAGDSAFGGGLFSPGGEWPEREVEADRSGPGDSGGPDVGDYDESGLPDRTGSSATSPARSDPRRRRRRRGRRGERESDRGRAAPAARDQSGGHYPELLSEEEPGRREERGRARGDSTPDDLADLDLEDVGGHGRERLEDDDFRRNERIERPAGSLKEEIDVELEQEIRREIEEIEELEREMGLRGPADARAKRGDEPPRGGGFSRGRGLAKPPIQEIFRRGDEVLVQVIKESIGTKGPTLSTYISIPGRYLVLMPGLNRVGVSRKIVDEGQRRKLREIMHELNPPKGLGFIVRTAGLERTKRELARDLAYLLRLWKVILRRIKKSKAPTPIYQESDMIIRTIRDIFNSEIDTIWIDEPSAFERAQDFLRVVMPRFVNRLKLYDEKVPLFHKYGIEDEIARIQRRHVPLPEGGSIVIDQTEALVAIDVNSGNFRVEDDAERTAYEMNLRAAKEIARQLRLRDLGGVIVNDFIDMREERHRRGVERALRDAIKRDRARTKILRMSAFGLIEMTRQRIRPSLKRSIYEDCPHCGGAGVAKTAESMAIDVMRLLALASHREEIRRILISVNSNVATYLNNRKRKEVARFESECNMAIQIGFLENAPAEYLKIECSDANGNEVRLHPMSPAGQRRGH